MNSAKHHYKTAVSLDHSCGDEKLKAKFGVLSK